MIISRFANSKGEQGGDGLFNYIEALYKTDIYSEDTDGDGLSDSYEFNNVLNSISIDSDFDGLNDNVDL